VFFLAFSGNAFSQWKAHPGSCFFHHSSSSSIYSTIDIVSDLPSSGAFVSDWAEARVVSFDYCYGPRQQSSPFDLAPESKLYATTNVRTGTVRANGNMSISDNGGTYQVMTEPRMESMGIGYILRWKYVIYNISNGGYIDYGPWIALSLPAISNAHDGVPFYYGTMHLKRGNNCDITVSVYFSTYSYSDWINNNHTKHTNPNAARCFSKQIGFKVQVRFVRINDLMDAYDVKKFDETFHNIIRFTRPAELGGGLGAFIFHSRVLVNYSSNHTCTTPSIAEATQNFNWVFASAIPNPGNTTGERDFNFTLTNCPRVNIGYHVHSNGKWVNPSQGIVGMSGSTPHANPAIGNPRGFGIQLQHRTGGHQHSGNVYIHQNEVTNPQSLPSNQRYTRNWQGAGTQNTSTGVTHTIPLRARVIRTSPANTPIVPGPFNTSVVFVIHYP